MLPRCEKSASIHVSIGGGVEAVVEVGWGVAHQRGGRC